MIWFETCRFPRLPSYSPTFKGKKKIDIKEEEKRKKEIGV